MSKSKPNVVGLFDRGRKKPPEMVLDVSVKFTMDSPVSVDTISHIIPSGKPKLLLAVGPGKVGKSTLLKWIAERATQRGEQIILGTLAPNKTLKRYFPETVHPDGNSTSSGAAFMELFFDTVAETRMNAIIDFPGDDTALPHLLDQGIDPVAMLDEAGVEVVALYMLAPRVEDLTAMAQLSAKGFRPAATALVLNKGVTFDPTMPPEPEFEQVLDHSAYRAEIDRGAVPIWMPRLYAAKTIEDSGLLFDQARQGGDLGPSDRMRTHSWLRAMETAFAPIASWLP